jgi:hypothetical protein
MKVGSLYEIKQYFWLLYPSRNVAADDPYMTPLSDASLAVQEAAWVSDKLKSNVSYIPEGSLFVLLEQKGEYCKVLSAEGAIGWMVFEEDQRWFKESIAEAKAIE